MRYRLKEEYYNMYDAVKLIVEIGFPIDKSFDDNSIIYNRLKKAGGVLDVWFERMDTIFEKYRIYQSNSGNVVFFCTQVVDNKVYGYGFIDGIWYNLTEVNGHYLVDTTEREEYVEVSIDAWLLLLQKEAIKLGYKKGTKIKSIKTNSIFTIETNIIFLSYNPYTFSNSNLTIGKYVIMEKGVWAEIVPNTLTLGFEEWGREEGYILYGVNKTKLPKYELTHDLNTLYDMYQDYLKSVK